MPETGREIEQPMQFTEKTLTGNEPPRCVDGRPAKESPQGPQMLGGSLHPLFIESLVSNTAFDAENVKIKLEKLKELRVPIGVHRGHHKDAKLGKSDCGFGDRLVDIVKTAKDNKEEIIKSLEIVYTKNGIDAGTLQNSYEFISNYDLAKINLTGEKLIGFTQENEAAIEDLDGNHGESIAFVNLKEGTTLDTLKVNERKQQAFNLDLWSAIEQSSILAKGAKTETLRDLSLIMYQATEMVLVEQKGNPALPVVLHW